MRDAFSSYHPAVSLAYFAAVITFSMAFSHPVLLAESLLFSALCAAKLRGRAAAGLIKFLLPMALLTSALNPLFNHAGATILLWLPDGNPLTLESVIYGLAAAAMFSSALLWFSCFNAVMTTDKFVYLFGRAIPALSLVLSMTLRFIPRFTSKAREISGAIRASGRDAAPDSRTVPGRGADPKQRSVPGRGGKIKALLSLARRGADTFSATLTWALSSAVITSDSMRARGYGLRGRTAFSIYRFDSRDRAAMAFIAVCAAVIVAGAAFGAVGWTYFPTLYGGKPSAATLGVFLCEAALGAMPLAINIWEDGKWSCSRSKV